MKSLSGWVEDPARRRVNVTQILKTWSGFDMRRKAFIIGATVAVFAAVLMLAKIASNPKLTLLYSGLESSAAGDVVRSLEQRGVPFEIRGGSIFVPGAQRDELRMTLASEGLPANTTQGYELLDSLSGFGTTSQMFDAAYWRAKEGELARTIVGGPLISKARVHIANAGSNPFQRSVKSTASVTVTANGGTLPQKHAQALRFLVASAVAGLSPENVAVIDGNGGLIGALEETKSSNGEDRADSMRASVQRLLEARVGAGNAVVEVSLDTVTETESIVERTFDPSSRVAISTETEERSTDSQNSEGQVTVASNLPDGDANDASGSSNQNRETRERVNYEVSETQREVVRQPGSIRRLTVAVLINGTPQLDEAGNQVIVPRPDTELDGMRELVASAVGFDEARGDVITLKSMNFQPINPMGTAAESSMLSGMQLDVMSIIQMVILGVVALGLGLFVVRPLLASQGGDAGGSALDGSPAMLPALEGGGDFAALPGLGGDLPAMGDVGFPMAPAFDGGDLGGLPAIGGADSPEGDAVERLRSLISDRQEETVEILRSWLEDGRQEKSR
ncbi:Flagellar M-ring protein [Shimia sp. SK013]|uniref:flagellar basal-body MS-ring/collar protein FliF n=1 Tax=Shimia sp. SK013 TaxID=1389006 RepID=UPI0006CD32A0|nr:flagellar basal-body MS-ring/collar protein FliF [Shimia sp. SK013]KPA20346.1 Flagellar M-ring protein [Shimia sp. SK013]